MKHFCSVILTALLLQFFSLCASAQNDGNIETCQLTLIDDAQHSEVSVLTFGSENKLSLPSGESLLRLTCTLNNQSVFSFNQKELISFTLNSQNMPLQRLASTSPAFLLPAGQFTAEFEISMHGSHDKSFQWQSVEEFFYQSLVGTITMGAFYGLCIVLILYVSFMGKILGDASFHLYSIYVFCASTFFLLQEGQLNIFLPQSSFLLSHHFYGLFAGFTVVSATFFVCHIAEIHTTWPKLVRFGLYPASIFVLLMATFMFLSDHGMISELFGFIMSRLTLVIMLMILSLVMVQTYRGVKMAWLVCVSLLIMFVAMIFRIMPFDVGDFLERYGLIIAFAIEAFIFAIVVSSRLKRIKIGKQRAENEANTDLLCNILNRRGWVSKAEDLLLHQKQQGGVLGLLYIDLNDFKIINDTHGHDCGDKVLIILAKIIQNQARETDFVGRIGGDEFVVVGHFEGEQESKNIAQRLNKRLSNINLQIDDNLNVNVSASIGYLTFPSPPESVNKMLSFADKAMYENKRERRRSQTATLQPG